MRFSLLKVTVALGVLTIASALQSCGNSEGKFTNNEISSRSRSSFHDINDELFEALKENNSRQVEMMMSNELVGRLSTQVKRQVELIGLKCKLGKYKLLDEFYFNYGLRVPYSDSVKTKHHGINNYSLNFGVPIGVKEVYMAFMIPDGNQEKWLITAMYAKFNYGWKLTELEINPYTINGGTAPQLFEQAKKQYAAGRIVDAMNTIDMAGMCYMPTGAWRYLKEAEMGDFSAKITKELYAKYRFPVTIAEVGTKPKVFRLTTQAMDGKYYPAVWYQSAVNLNDTAAARRENDQVKKVIDQHFAGLSQGKKYVFYSVFSNPVKGKVMGRPVNFTDAH